MKSVHRSGLDVCKAGLSLLGDISSGHQMHGNYECPAMSLSLLCILKETEVERVLH